MRPKSEEKFKDKIPELTPRSHNLNASVIKKVNQVVRGTANYFAAPFTRNLRVFTKLDKWCKTAEVKTSADPILLLNFTLDIFIPFDLCIKMSALRGNEMLSSYNLCSSVDDLSEKFIPTRWSPAVCRRCRRPRAKSP